MLGSQNFGSAEVTPRGYMHAICVPPCRIFLLWIKQ